MAPNTEEEAVEYEDPPHWVLLGWLEAFFGLASMKVWTCEEYDGGGWA